MNKKKAALQAVELLKAEYPDAICSLDYQKPHELMIATRLAAQCTDARVNIVCVDLFQKYQSVRDFAEADVADVEAIVKPCGFYHTKARDIVECAKILLIKHGGKVPGTMEELLKLPGVGRKTANLILGDVFKAPGAVVVDTHCIRLSNRMGLVDNQKDPAKIEPLLRAQLPPEKSSDFCHRLVLHGRAVCTARSPECGRCCVRHVCQTGSGQ